MAEGRRADVELRLPADNAYVSVLRSTTATLASRLGFDLGTIEDLRVAVGEACALTLPEADAGTGLTAEFFPSSTHLTVAVSVSGTHVGSPDRESFAWQVLDTLAPGATAEAAEGRLRVVLTVGREPVPAGS